MDFEMNMGEGDNTCVDSVVDSSIETQCSVPVIDDNSIDNGNNAKTADEQADADEDRDGHSEVKGWDVPSLEEQQKLNESLLATSSYTMKLYFLAKIPRPAEDDIKSQIRHADLQLNQKTQTRESVKAALRMKQADRTKLVQKLKCARDEERSCRDAIQSKFKELEVSKAPLESIRNALSVHEIDKKIHDMQYRIEHEHFTVREQKQMLSDIKQLKVSRTQLPAGPQSQLSELLEQKKQIQEGNKKLKHELDALKKKLFQAERSIEAIKKELLLLDEAAEKLDAERNAANDACQKAYEDLRPLKKQNYEKHIEFYQNKSDIEAAKRFASASDIDELDKLCKTQVERILNMWNKNEEFRKDYMKNSKRIDLKCLVENVNGKSVVTDSQEESLPPKNYYENGRRGDGITHYSHSHEEVNSGQDSFGRNKTQKNVTAPQNSGQKLPKQVQEAELETESELQTVVEEEEEDLVKREEEAAKEREKRREEQMAKAKEAEQRKARLAQNAKAKADARAQKSAERKQKEQQKRANKKIAPAMASMDTADRASLKETKPTVNITRAQKKKRRVPEKSNLRPRITPARKTYGKENQRWLWTLLPSGVLCFFLLFYLYLIL
eukprot:Gb_11565 [translate_table: standard]